MKRITELINFLDSEDEPLPKRLKLADCAFKSPALPIHFKEINLLRWLMGLVRTGDNEVLIIIKDWLDSEEITNINKTDVSQDDVFELLKILENIISNDEISNFQSIIVDIFLSIINVRTFQQYFKCDIKLYFKLIIQFIKKIQDIKQLDLLLKSDILFNRLYFKDKSSYKYFCKICLPTLGELFCSNENFKPKVIELVKRSLFQNTRLLKPYLLDLTETENKANDFQIPNAIISAIGDNYNRRNSSAITLMYSSICSLYESNFELIFRFTIILLEICGFNVKEKFNITFDCSDCDYDVSFSIEIINNLYKNLSILKTSSDNKINKIDFCSTTQTLIRTIMNISDPSRTIMQLISNAINAEPLILDQMLTSIIPYVMFNNTVNEGMEIGEYTILLMNMINTSAKLSRLTNLIAKMLPLLKKHSVDLTGEVFTFKGNLETNNLTKTNDFGLNLPQVVLDCFSKHFLNLSGWQIINIFSTLNHHLKPVKDIVHNKEDDSHHTYIELLCNLFSTFLLTVRVAEHTTTDSIVKKFVKCMIELKEILNVLGNELLESNHNQYITRAYLNLCYAWGELYILLNTYSSTEEVSSYLKSTNSHYQICCISYIHSYLTAEQWGLITERITNFGEKRCKNILQSLQLQCIKAIFLYEDGTVDISVLFPRNLIQNPSMEILLSDRFITNVLMSNLQQNLISSLAKAFIKDALNEKTCFKFDKKILDSSELNETIVLNVLLNIVKHFKNKDEKVLNMKEFMDSLIVKPLEDISNDITEIYDNFKHYIKREIMNREKIKENLGLLEKLPVMSLKGNVQLIVFLYLCALLSELKECGLTQQLERLITGFFQYPSNLLVSQPKFVTSFMFKNMTNCENVFGYWLDNFIHSSCLLENFHILITYLLKKFNGDQKSRKCTIQVINSINKIKKNKIPIELKTIIEEHKQQIYNAIIDWLSSTTQITAETLYFYALSLKHFFPIDGPQKENLLKDLQKNIEIIILYSEPLKSRASLLLFSTILTHKKQLEIVDDDLILRIWKTVQTLQISKDSKKEHLQVITLIFEHISSKKFSVIWTDLSEFVTVSVKDEQNDSFKKTLIALNGILQCSLNAVKHSMWQNKMENVLAQINGIIENRNKEFKEEFINFELKIIHANKFVITGPMIDEILQTVSILFTTPQKQLSEHFKLSVQLMTSLLKYRESLMTDRLPSFLQRYRLLLKNLCRSSDSTIQTEATEDLANCAHEFEKLTSVLASFGKYFQRIAVYLIADFLLEYETVSIYPNVKMHIDNCVYYLIGLFDQHAVSFLMRSLSTASTELFKYMHSNYKRYYKFTGKV